MQCSGVSVADFEQENASQKQHPILFSFLHNYCLTEKKSLFCIFPFFEKLFWETGKIKGYIYWNLKRYETGIHFQGFKSIKLQILLVIV